VFLRLGCISLVAIAFSIKSYSAPSIDELKGYSKKIRDLRSEKNNVDKSMAKLETLLDGCDTHNQPFNTCSGEIVGPVTDKTILNMKQSLGALRAKALTLDKELEKYYPPEKQIQDRWDVAAQAKPAYEDRNDKAAKPFPVAPPYNRLDQEARIDLKGFQLDAKNLLMDISITKSDLQKRQLEIQTLMGVMDRSLLGEYTKYAIEQSMDSDKNKKLICETAAMCSDTKKMKSQMNSINRKVKTFEQFRKEQLALRSQSQMTGGNSSATGAGKKQ
jgi:hypothetical protein